MIKKFIPFDLHLMSWGLKGEAYEEARARYHLEGYDLDMALADIRFRRDPVARRKEILRIDRDHGKISLYEYERELLKLEGRGDDLRANLELDVKFGKLDAYETERSLATIEIKDETERAIRLLEIDFQFGKLKEREFEKAVATVKGEPWVGILDDGFDLEQGVNGFYFILDWNQPWIEYLKTAGYGNRSDLRDEEIVEEWFADVCRAQTIEDDVFVRFSEK